MKLKALTRREGTRAMRLSVSVSRVPENTLLKPRTTALLRTIPTFAKSTPGRSSGTAMRKRPSATAAVPVSYSSGGGGHGDIGAGKGRPRLPCDRSLDKAIRLGPGGNSMRESATINGNRFILSSLLRTFGTGSTASKRIWPASATDPVAASNPAIPHHGSAILLKLCFSSAGGVVILSIKLVAARSARLRSRPLAPGPARRPRPPATLSRSQW